jgi:hypothetical protein
VANADFRPSQSPSEPAFDWITYSDAEKTKDRTLQESIAFYEPAMEVLVFVFLLSKSGNSMAMWRRKLIVPNNTRLTLGAQISQAKAGLAKQYPIYIDECVLSATSVGMTVLTRFLCQDLQYHLRQQTPNRSYQQRKRRGNGSDGFASICFAFCCYLVMYRVSCSRRSVQYCSRIVVAGISSFDVMT